MKLRARPTRIWGWIVTQRGMWAGLGLLILFTHATTAAELKRVLLLHSLGREFAPFSVFSSRFRTELAQQFPGPVEFFDVPLPSARADQLPDDGPMLDYLHSLFGGRPPDLVVPVGGPAVRFAQRHKQHFFPTTPMLLASTDARNIQASALATNDATAVVNLDLAGVIQNILQVLPATTNVVVVIGNSVLEQFWVTQVRQEFAGFTNRVGFSWFNELSYEEMRRRAAVLPPRSAIFYGVLWVDADGVPHEEERALAGLRAVANAPMFGLYDFHLGRGIVGGALLSLQDLGRNTAGVAGRILQGEPPSSLRIPPQTTGKPVFDWRELRRWGIRDSDLPPGSVVQFYQPTFWELYRWWIAGLAGFCLCQAALIIALLVQRSKRRQGEAVLLLQRAELAHVTRVSTLGQLTSSLAHELNQPLGAILRNAEAGELMLQDPAPDLEEIRAILADIRADEQRAGEVIDRVRALLKRRELERGPLDLEQLAGEVITLLRPDAELRQVRLTLTLTSALPSLQGDRVRLQQVLLNLLLNAMDAVRANPPANRLVTVRARHTGATVEISVSDNGPGIPADQMPRLFTPFFTSKPNGLGMGLVISRSIVQEHNGQLSVHNEPDGGVTFTIVLPVNGAGPVRKA